MVTFRTRLRATGGSTVAVVIAPETVESFGRGRRVPITVTVDGDHTYRSTITSMGGQYLISFNATARARTGRGAGDEVEISLEVDDAPRTVEMPSALADVVAADPDLAGR